MGFVGVAVVLPPRWTVIRGGSTTAAPTYHYTIDRALVVCPSRLYTLGATAGLSSSAGNTVGQANRGTRNFNLDRPLDCLIGCAVGASMQGVALAGMGTLQAVSKRKRLTAAELAALTRGR